MLDHRSMDEKHGRADRWHTLRHVLFSCLRFLESGCRTLRVFEGCARTGTADEGASEIMIVEFSVRILGPLCEENSEHHLDP